MSLHDLDLGKTSMVEHEINLEPNSWPFCERYQPIPQAMYREVHKHCQEILEVGVIRLSSHLWAFTVALVWKQDGKLWFCIDLCRLNNMTVKDVYSLPWIQETLYCLHGMVWFVSLGLKLGYWQVRIKEECKAYMAIIMGPLGFYEYECVPFGLMSAPTTFCHHMETCLGDLQLNWCIIYLDDIIVFATIPKEHLNSMQAVFTKL